MSEVRRMSSLHPLVFSGPSGSGKSTLVQRLMKEYPGCFAFSVSRELFFCLLARFTFYHAMHMHKRGICCHTVSVCLSRSGVAPKRIKISSKFFHHLVATPF